MVKNETALAPKQNEISIVPERTGIWRWIIEMSCMSNNEEVVLHRDSDISHEEFGKSEIKRRLAGDFRSPKLVLSRPVFAVEVAAGLDVAYRGDRFEEKCPPITSTLDGLHRFFRDVEWRRNFTDDATVSRIVADIVAYSYYDCMSGGMDKTCVRACRAVVRQYGCDLNEPVYPGRVKGGNMDDYSSWYTLGDWMKETEDEVADAEFLRDAGPLLGQAFPALPPASER